MFQIAVQMLIGDRVKYLTLICALALSSVLMMQQGGVFWGVMRSTVTLLRNTKVPIWVMDPNIQQANQALPLRDTDLARVRSIPEVEWAVPLFSATTTIKVPNGRFMTVKVLGVDSSTLLGVPHKLISGRLDDLWKSDAIILTTRALARLNTGKKTYGIGDVLDLNDHEVRIVGIVEQEESAFGEPEIYTTYERAIQIFPSVRKNLSYILVKQRDGVSVEKAVEAIESRTALKAFSEEALFWKTLKFYTVETGVPLSFFITIILGFIVGVAVSGQTFYSFVHENIGNFAALKAMGANNRTLAMMLLTQAFFASLIGYGIGLGLTVLFGYSIESVNNLPFYLTSTVVMMVFLSIVFISLVSAVIGIREIIRLEPAEVFRA